MKIKIEVDGVMRDVEISEESYKEIVKTVNDDDWKPSYPEKYYYNNDAGLAKCSIWAGAKVDNLRSKTGNVFKTKGEAEYVFKIKNTKIENFIASYKYKHEDAKNVEWNKETERLEAKYYIYFSYESYEFRVTWSYGNVRYLHNIYFTDQKVAQKCTDELNRMNAVEWLK